MAGDQYNLGLLDDDDYKVSVLRTKLLGIGECFMYRLPKGSKSPYRYVENFAWSEIRVTFFLRRTICFSLYVCILTFDFFVSSIARPKNDRADGWPLTKPLQCVSLRVERRGDVLLLIFTYTHGDVGPKSQQKLFALCPIDIVNQSDSEKKKMGHFVEAVVDSTRYFVVRVKDEKADREALIGLGFRDREEAGDFRMALAKYESDIKREMAGRR